MSIEEKKKKGGKLKWIIIVIVLIAIIGTVAGGGSKEPKKVTSTNSDSTSVDNADDSTTSESVNTEPMDTDFGIGDTADFDGVQIKLSSAILSKGDGKFVRPDNGKYFLELIFYIDNQSSSDISVSSMVSFEAYCDDFSLNQDLIGYQAPEVDGISQLDGSVAAGKKMNGVISYQVPQDFSTFEISFAPSFWRNNKVTYSFSREDVDASAIQ